MGRCEHGLCEHGSVNMVCCSSFTIVLALLLGNLSDGNRVDVDAGMIQKDMDTVEADQGTAQKDMETVHQSGTCAEDPDLMCCEEETWSLIQGVQSEETWPNFHPTTGIDNNQVSSTGKQYYTLTLGKGSEHEVQIPIIMDLLDSPQGGSGYNRYAANRNCFAFASHQLSQTPANSQALKKKWGESPVDTTSPKGIGEKTLADALQRRERAIFLGRDLSQVPLPLTLAKEEQSNDDLSVQEKVVFDGKQKYFLIAVFMKNGEYHFWGSFRDRGWACTPSKVSGSTDTWTFQLRKDLAANCPTDTLWNSLRKKGNYNPVTLGNVKPRDADNFFSILKFPSKTSASGMVPVSTGYYLFPCRTWKSTSGDVNTC